ncbi:hypothetical protein HAZT_HAZT002556 [Hyalella azteca]|uniref:MYND-type domain-containing protein n=1 Tax=Hyalella azteca TaxID=294128 RepID=A0A6A0HD94_HYAAZ|nr:hypothetical protein HAZT_HAZT002556 [Hyalella azteca]
MLYLTGPYSCLYATMADAAYPTQVRASKPSDVSCRAATHIIPTSLRLRRKPPAPHPVLLTMAACVVFVLLGQIRCFLLNLATMAGQVCSQCHRTSYCSKSHQSLHWKLGHKHECKKLAAGPGPSSVCAARTSLLFPEAEIILEPQENASESDDDDAELTEDQIRERLAQFSDAQIVAGAHDDPYSIDTLENVATADADPVFTAFKEQMDKHPEQARSNKYLSLKVIRYHRGGAPLFCAQQPKPVRGKRHNCPHCSRPRTFEFQVMPQMLDHLKLDVVEGPSLDWGVLLVFTCNCDVKFGYVEELVFKQDYAECQEKAPSQQ